jgi:hypothetical protein
LGSIPTRSSFFATTWSGFLQYSVSLGMCLSAWGRSARPQVEALRSHAGHGGTADISPDLKRPEREAYHPLVYLSSAEVRMRGVLQPLSL